MSISIHIPTPLRPYTNAQPSVELSADTVQVALEALIQSYPALQKHLFDARGRLRSFVNIYLGDEDIRQMDGLNTLLEEGDELTLVPSIAGGAR